MAFDRAGVIAPPAELQSGSHLGNVKIIAAVFTLVTFGFKTFAANAVAVVMNLVVIGCQHPAAGADVIFFGGTPEAYPPGIRTGKHIFRAIIIAAFRTLFKEFFCTFSAHPALSAPDVKQFIISTPGMALFTFTLHRFELLQDYWGESF